MDISPRKSLKRSLDPVDEWLQNEGYVRKHVPRDSTCLFRAFGEQIYSTQHYHIRVRRECVDFMRENSHLFEQSISIPFESYLEQMSCFTESGGPNEIKAMSLLYRREVFIFDGFRMTAGPATDNGFEDTVHLCHTPHKQYESVYAKDFIATAAYCQSLVYKTLYKEVFKMPNVDETVQKMLHDRTPSLRHDKFFLKGNMDLREKLTTELLSKIEKGGETNEEDKSIARGITPFPYRVAKALDPNIYRNTDFDIWHELRREVKNAGWTRWNLTELQVGGKCLVQVDCKEKELDKTNNNFGRLSLDKDANGNASKDSLKVTAGKREPALLHGHIQEMSENEGPVVVFIEELGEKRTLPYAALKPVGPRRNKPSNWSPNVCRRNPTFDSSQRWKKTWNSNTRKTKETSSSYVAPKNPVDRNNNTNDNKTDKTKDPAQVEDWDEQSSDQRKSDELKNYTMETYNSCQGFAAENTIDVRPVTVVLDNVPPSLRAPPPPPVPTARNTEDYTKNSSTSSSSQSVKISASCDNAERRSPNVGSLPPESIIPPLQQVSLHPPNEAFYPSPAGMPPMYPINQNMMCPSPDGNAYPFPFPCFTDEPPTPGSLLDRTIRAINFAVPPSVDANGSDLPFSDTMTLRFFYNLGLEYFRATHALGCGATGQALNPPANFAAPGSFVGPPNNAPIESNNRQTMGPGKDDENSHPEVVTHRQNYATARRRNENSSNMGKFNSVQQQQQQQQQPQQVTKTFGSRRNDATEYSHKSHETGGTRPVAEHYRAQTHATDRAKDHSNNNPRRNIPPSRYKRNVDGRNRCFIPGHVYHAQHQQPPIYAHNPTSLESPGYQGAKSPEVPQQAGNPTIWQGQASPPSGGLANQQPTYHGPWGPQPIYAAMPYYPNEAEGFYAHAPGGFYSIPYLPAGGAEIVDGNAPNYPSQSYPPIAENNYAQTMSAVYPPYVYPQVYSGLPQQGGQENWFPVPPGQGQIVQYPPMQTPQTPPNVHGSPSP